MPKLNDITNFVTPNNFKFSGVDAADLESSQYTLVNIDVDCSYSIDRYVGPLLSCLKAIFNACNSNNNPNRDNLLLRVSTFSSNTKEIHGYQLLGQVDTSEYDKNIRPISNTALNDAVHTSIDAGLSYARDLVRNQGISVNMINLVLTDGEDNASAYTPRQIRTLVDAAKKDEFLESILNIAVGVNVNNCRAALDSFFNEAGFDKFIEVTDDINDLMKAADFISKSIQSQSQALGTGGPSQVLNWGSSVPSIEI